MSISVWQDFFLMLYEYTCSASIDANRLPPVISVYMTALAITEEFSFLEVTSNLSHYANQHVPHPH